MHCPTRLLRPLLAAALLGAPLASQVTPRTAESGEQRPTPKVLGVDVTYLANEGFYLESGRYAVLLDAFVREATGNFASLPSETHRQLVNALPPYDKLTIVLVSHDHPDHVQWRGLEKYLVNNPQAQLMTAPQVLRGLKNATQDFEAIQRRVSPVPTARGSFKTLMQDEMSIDFFELSHGGKGNETVTNLGHLIEMGGVRILHVGDAEPTVGNFSAYDLDSKGIDLAFVPYWFFASPVGMRVLHEEIKARTVVACHVPPREVETLGQLLQEQLPDVVLFREPLEKRSFQPAASPAAPAKGEGG